MSIKAIKTLLTFISLALTMLIIFYFPYIINTNNYSKIKKGQCYDVITYICKNSEICKYKIYEDTSKIIIYSTPATPPMTLRCIKDNKYYILKNINSITYL